VQDTALRRALDDVIEVYETDNCSAWDCGADGTYTQRRPRDGEAGRAAQAVFIGRAGATG
jgi:polyphosphate kinase